MEWELHIPSCRRARSQSRNLSNHTSRHLRLHSNFPPSTLLEFGRMLWSQHPIFKRKDLSVT
eukprot:c47836_g1_i1 orf=3-185(-)